MDHTFHPLLLNLSLFIYMLLVRDTETAKAFAQDFGLPPNRSTLAPVCPANNSHGCMQQAQVLVAVHEQELPTRVGAQRRRGHQLLLPLS